MEKYGVLFGKSELKEAFHIMSGVDIFLSYYWTVFKLQWISSYPAISVFCLLEDREWVFSFENTHSYRLLLYYYCFQRDFLFLLEIQHASTYFLLIFFSGFFCLFALVVLRLLSLSGYVYVHFRKEKDTSTRA